MKQYYCDEHGPVLKLGEFKSTIPGMTMTPFCPICQREIFPDDPLTEIERQGKPAVTFEDWKARDDMPVLDMGRIKLPESDDA